MTASNDRLSLDEKREGYTLPCVAYPLCLMG